MFAPEKRTPEGGIQKFFVDDVVSTMI